MSSGGSNRLISPAELADIIGISRDTIYRRWRDLGLRGIRIGRELRFRQRDVAAWIESNEIGVAA